MGRVKESPWVLSSKGGRAYLDVRGPEGRTQTALGLPYDAERSSPADRRRALEAAEAKYRELTDGRLLAEHARIRTSLTFAELYALYIQRWQPDDAADVNARKRAQTAFIVRKGYGQSVTDWASDEAKRPDGSKRWRGDTRTPLERITADSGPVDFLAWRLLSVVRKTMRKEKSNLVQFFGWAKAAGYLASLPPVELPDGGGKRALVNGRGVHIPMTPLQAAQIVAVMPEWSSKPSRRKPDGELYTPAGRFLVRPFFEFMSMTGLREATIERLEVPRNWKPGAKSLQLDEDDDKARYGRAFPLTKAAAALLEKYAPASGHIFGHHDFRKHLKAAAEVVFKEEPDKATHFGGYHLRHFVGTFLANRAGTNLAAASFVMGHTDLSTTSIYVHADADAARALLEGVEKERLKAARQAAAWARKQG